MLTIRDLLAFQIGNRAAIERVAATRWSILAGLILIGTAGLARNYDQVSLLHSPGRLAGPFVASLITSFFVFCVIHPVLRLGKQPGAPGFSSQYFSFFGAFALTAPIAWLYALPVERWLNPLGAAQVNVTLLAIVSMWRVILLTRVIQVITTLPFMVCLLVLLGPVSVEVFLAGMAYEILHFDVAGGMGGIVMSRAQVDQFMDGVNGGVLAVAFFSMPVVWTAMLTIALKFRRERRAFPAPISSPAPRAVLVLCGMCLLAWAIIAIAPQRKEYHFSTLSLLLSPGRYPEAFDYLEKVGPDAFPSTRPLPPDPWGRGADFRVPNLLRELDDDRAAWIYETYFGHALVLVQRLVHTRGDFGEYVIVAENLERLPGGPEFLRAHQEDWLRVLAKMNERESRYASEGRPPNRLAPILQRAGIDIPPP